MTEPVSTLVHPISPVPTAPGEAGTITVESKVALQVMIPMEDRFRLLIASRMENLDGEEPVSSSGACGVGQPVGPA